MRLVTIGLAVVLAASVAMVPACKRHAGAPGESKPGKLVSEVLMSNPHAAGQLISGFHSMENGAWRWTEKEFAISLLRPPQARQKGAVLSVRLTIPPVTIERLQTISLAASIHGTPLDPETYSAPGNYVYRRAVPAALLTDDPVRVDFALDKVIPPTGPDIRNLGIVVLAIGLSPQ